jgi:hypothetical protein
MDVGAKKTLWSILLALSLGVLCPRPGSAQNLHNMVSSRERVFPQAGGGIIAMAEDAAGHFYVLSNPGHTVQVFDASGKQIAQIPGANSGDVTLHYAVDLDVAPNGNILVADRSANTVDVFAADGSLRARVSVSAPTSVVALSNGQFAVTTLRTAHPVEVIDQNGRVVRGFGESHDAQSATGDNTTSPPPLADTGRIVGDSADNLYFAALSSDSDPQVRKYDRFGYAAYAADVPTPAADQTTALDDRVQFGFSFMRLNRSDQINTWTTVGDSGKVQFGSNVGLGLAGLMAGQGRGGRGGASTVAGTFTADTSLTQPTFDMHLGVKANQRGGREGAGSTTSQQDSSSATTDTAKLQYFAPGSFSSSSDFSSSNSDDTSDSGDADTAASTGAALQYTAPSSATTDSSSTVPGTLDYMIGTPQSGAVPGAGIGGFSSFFLGGFGPRPGGFGHPFLGGAGMPGGSPLDHGGLGGSFGAGHAGLGTGMGGRPDFGGRGRFGASDLSFVGSMRIILDRAHPVETAQKKLTAVGVDHQTQEIWAAIGPMLVHFDKYGNSMDTYYLTTPEGALLQTTAIVVEPNRLLVGSNAGGIYEFDRPDKTTSSHSAQIGAQIEKKPAQ